MVYDGFDLKRLIYPLFPETFWQEYWEKRPLLVQNRQTQYYGDLFSLAQVDHVLLQARPQPPEIRIVCNQKDLLPDTYINSDRSLNLNQIYKAYDEGHTLILNGIQKFQPTLAAFCQDLQQFLNHSVIANLYLSPQNSRGLMAHYDTHDVFVLQIEGSKQWQIYDPIQPLPLLGSFQPVIPDAHLGEPLQSVTLQPGDLLYIPRGFIHEAKTTEAFSLHLTIGIYPSQWIDLIHQSLVAVSLRDVRFRQALPVKFLDQKDAALQLQQTFHDLIAALLNNANVEDGLAGLEEHLIHQMPSVPDGHFTQIIDTLNTIQLDTVMTCRTNMRCRAVDRFTSAAIQFSGNTISGARRIYPALCFIAETKTFTVQELPGTLSEDDKIKLVQRLVRGGLLRVKRSPTSDSLKIHEFPSDRVADMAQVKGEG
jgi:ribosomal protein L16 Arg81 hydroxylase